MFYKISVTKIFAKFTEKHCVGVIFDKAAGLNACRLIKKTLQHRCFPMNIARFVRTPFVTQQLQWLLLNIDDDRYDSDKDINDYNGSKKLVRGIINL